MNNIRIKNIYYMLSYAFQTLHETGISDISAETFDHIHNLFATILIKGTTTQVKRGLYREYICNQETITGLRGKVNTAEVIKQQSLPQGRLVCSFDEFSSDCPHNQALKSVLTLLLRHGYVKPEIKKAIRKLLLYFSDVSYVEPSLIRWDSMKYHRNNASYRMLMGICKLTVKGLLMREEDGTYKLSSWLQDEAMSTLYERFLLEYYRAEHARYKARKTQISWDMTYASNYMPRMESDVFLSNGEKKLIIDAKYYTRTLTQRFGSEGKRTYHSHNLYQIYTYVKNSDKSATGNVAGVLLYANTDEAITPDEELIIGGNHISLRTLDLNQDWPLIREQLDSLCNWLDAG